MNDNMSRLMKMDFERGNGVKAEEIAKYIGEEKVFDDKVIQVSKQRFKEIVNAFIKIENKDYKKIIENMNIEKDKTFIHSYEIYLANRFTNNITIEALEHGVFKNNNETNLRKKAEKDKKDLMLYLIEIRSDYAHVLSDIKIDEEDSQLITLTQFIHNKKEIIHNDFIYGDTKTIHKDRYNRIFAYIEKKTKNLYNSLKKENIKKMNKNEPLLAVEQMINIIIQDSNRQTDEYNLINEYNSFNNDNTENIKSYIYTLMQKHEYYHTPYKPL